MYPCSQGCTPTNDTHVRQGNETTLMQDDGNPPTEACLVPPAMSTGPERVPCWVMYPMVCAAKDYTPGLYGLCWKYP